MQTGFDFVYLYRWRIYFQLEGQEGVSEEVTFKMRLKDKEKPSWKDLEKDHSCGRSMDCSREEEA